MSWRSERMSSKNITSCRREEDHRIDARTARTSVQWSLHEVPDEREVERRLEATVEVVLRDQILKRDCREGAGRSCGSLVPIMIGCIPPAAEVMREDHATDTAVLIARRARFSTG